MKQYYLDLCFKSEPFGDVVSYEIGIYDNLLFNSYEEAEYYAEQEKYRLAENEVFTINEMEIGVD